MSALERYAALVGAGEIDELFQLASSLKGLRVQHVNSTAVGGGVAEILVGLVPLMREVGLDASWTVLEGTQEFYDVTKAFHNALHGQTVPITREMLETYWAVQEQNRSKLDPLADVVVLHDPQPAGLAAYREGHRARFIWRCHIDLSHADPAVWGVIRSHVQHCDAAVFHLPEYARDLEIDQCIIPPAIDPFTEKNREMGPEEIASVLERLAIDPERPIVLQVSRFDRLKDPVGVIEAFRIASKWVDGQLVLAGGSAGDDPEGAVVLAETMARAAEVPNVRVLDLPPDSHAEINALQRAASVVIQKSIREGFGLVVTEAMWKRKPVIGANVGGIRRQILHGETGFLANTVEGVAWHARELLASPDRAHRMGDQAREQVRTNFLLHHNLRSWLLLLLGLDYPGEGIVMLSAPQDPARA